MTLLMYIAVPLVLVLLVVPMFFWDKGRRSLVLALRSLWLHKLRSMLSVLGIIIGTGAVIALMAFGEGSMQDALDAIKRQGATNIMVRSVKPPDDSATSSQQGFYVAYGITALDYEMFESIDSVVRLVPMRIIPQDVRYLARLHNGRVVATTPQYAEIHKLDLSSGRFLTDDDDFWMKNVAVLGSAVAEKLFPYEDPIGHTVRLQNHFYLVVGVLRERTPLSGGGGQSVEDFNNDVYIPLSTCRGRYGLRVQIRQSGVRYGEMVYLNQVTLTVSDTEMVRPTARHIEDILRSHVKADWIVTAPLDKLQEAEETKERFTLLLALIASISLFVGGIGIMNIMLATVTERTREIGIRRALGAKRRDITMQFLIESVVQTTVGGILGLLMGLGVVYVVPLLLAMVWHRDLPAKVHVPSIFISLIVAIGVGIVFGMYPARRAALLDPIEALRHE